MLNTAGPDLSGNEKKYLKDSIDRWEKGEFNYYKDKFTEALKKYLGVKHVLLTNSGTGALHLGCMALGLKEGDEVITSEISYIASANAIKYTGATPVYCDVAKDTWCIDENEIEGLITPNTKAIMPVYIYGNMPDMTKIMDVARKYGLRVISDACPAMGAEQNSKKAGNIADIECFSFQGAKVMTTGEGGCITTNDDFLWSRIQFFNNNCEVEGKKFYHNGVGHCYDMSNVLAAMGLAQLERLDSFIDKKRQIFEWYKRGLGDAYTMNRERPGTKCTYWMSSIMLNGDEYTRVKFMKYLKESGIDTRPMFYPISSFNGNDGEFPRNMSSGNPNAYDVGFLGVNLPSGLGLTKENIDYITSTIKKYESL